MQRHPLHPRGSVRLNIALAIVGTLCLFKGLESAYVRVVNWNPVELTCAEYLARPPPQAWVRLSGCTLDILGASYRTSPDVTKEVFLPVYEDGARVSAGTTLLLATRDARYVELVAEIVHMRDPHRVYSFATSHPEQVQPRHLTLTGLVRSGMDLSDSDRGRLRRLSGAPSTALTVLDDRDEPSSAVALFFLTIAFGAYGFLAGPAIGRWRATRG